MQDCARGWQHGTQDILRDIMVFGIIRRDWVLRLIQGYFLMYLWLNRLERLTVNQEYKGSSPFGYAKTSMKIKVRVLGGRKWMAQ